MDSNGNTIHCQTFFIDTHCTGPPVPKRYATTRGAIVDRREFAYLVKRIVTSKRFRSVEGFVAWARRHQRVVIPRQTVYEWRRKMRRELDPKKFPVINRALTLAVAPSEAGQLKGRLHLCVRFSPVAAQLMLQGKSYATFRSDRRILKNLKSAGRRLLQRHAAAKDVQHLEAVAAHRKPYQDLSAIDLYRVEKLRQAARVAARTTA
jgi:hypothetical protein